MKKEFDNEKRGALFPAKLKGLNLPDVTGNIEINGVRYRLAGWVNTMKDGTQYYSLQATIQIGRAHV